MNNVNKDKKTNHALMILPGAGILLFILIFGGCSTNKNLVGVNENNRTVADYILYVNNNNEKVPDHEYINTALVKLADATNAMAAETNYTIKGNLNMAKEYANKITHNANAATHADNIRRSADILSTELHNLQLAKYSSLTNEASALKTASASINPAVLTNNQRNAIMSFFSRSAMLLEKMN